jgi:hypothetical protein
VWTPIWSILRPPAQSCSQNGFSPLHVPVAGPRRVEETGELIAAAAGAGSALVVDHEQPRSVAELVARIEREQGRLDVLINDIFGGPALAHGRRGRARQDVVVRPLADQDARRERAVAAGRRSPLPVRHKPSVGLEPTTPSLPWKCSTD